MHLRVFLSVALVCVLRVSAAPATPATGPVRDLGPLLAPIAAAQRVPGLSVMVLKGDRAVAAGVAGVRRMGAAERIAIDDEFLLCSGTKPMTATLVALAIENGKLTRTTTLGEIFPDTFKRMRREWRAVTVEQLLNHRAGVPNEAGRIWSLLRVQFSSASVAEKRQAIVAKIFSRPPAATPGSRYVYTALDYIILGAILEKIAGQPWEELIEKQLWRPLGIAHGGFGAPGTPGKVDQPWGHWGMLGVGRPVRPGGFWAKLNVPLFFGPAGTARLTMNDWAKFVALHLRGDPANPAHQAQLLNANSFATLHTVAPGSFYESGWIVHQRPWAKGPRSRDTGRALSSEGDNGFWHVEAWVAPEIDLAVLVICNQGGATSDKPAARACKAALDALVKEFGAAP